MVLINGFILNMIKIYIVYGIRKGVKYTKSTYYLYKKFLII